MRRVFVGGLLLGLLCACDRPSWARHDPASQPTAADMKPAPAKAPIPIVPESIPPIEPWASNLIGKPLRAAFPKDGPCVGNLDLVDLRYSGPAPGSRVSGWGWDIMARRGVTQVLLADKDGLIVGAGSGGTPRPDVPPVLPQVTSKATGWRAWTSRVAGQVMAFGVLTDGTAVCALGQIEL